MVMSCHSPCGLFALVGRAWIGTIHLSLVISWADVQAWQPCPAAIGGHVTRLPQGRMRISFKNHKQKIVKLYNIKYISRILSKPDFSTQQPCVCVRVLPLCENREEDFVLMQQFSGWERPKFFLGFFCRATRWAMWAVSLHTAAKHIVYTHSGHTRHSCTHKAPSHMDSQLYIQPHSQAWNGILLGCDRIIHLTNKLIPQM